MSGGGYIKLPPMGGGGSSPYTPPFDFKSIAGLVFDLNPADANGFQVTPTDGMSVAGMTDRSNRGYYVYQSSGSAQPIYHVVSGFGTKSAPYINFNGSTQYLNNSASPRVGPPTFEAGTEVTTGAPNIGVNTGDPVFTAFLVFQLAVTNVDQPIIGWGDQAGTLTACGLYTPANGNYQWAFAGGNSWLSNTPMDTQPTILTAQKFAKGAINTTMLMRRNGVALSLSTGSTSTPSVTACPIMIGGWSGWTNNLMNGKLARVLIYGRALSAYEISIVETQLNSLIGVY